MDRRLNPLMAMAAALMLCGCAVPGLAEDTGVASRPRQPVAFQLNELLASNRTGRVDDQGRTSDWVELYNTSSQPQQLNGYHLTDDLQVPDKWPFPAIRVAAEGYQLVWMSGADGAGTEPKARRTANVLLPFDNLLIESGVDWKYFAGMSQPERSRSQDHVQGWTQISFDDSAFRLGLSGFGYGDEDDCGRQRMAGCGRRQMDKAVGPAAPRVLLEVPRVG